MRERKYNILELQEQRKLWDGICTKYLKNSLEIEGKKLAVDMYIDGYSLADISSKTNIPIKQITRLVDRCVLTNKKTNKPYGYTALLPYKRVSTNSQHFSDVSCLKKTRGSFKQLLLKYPTLPSFIANNYFRKDGATLEKNIKISNLHNKFLSECRKLKIQDYEYPFNTLDKARRSFYSYIKELELTYVNEAMIREGKNTFQKFNSTGIGISSRPIPLAPYSVVQIDGHKIDMLYTVEVINRHNEIILMPATRMWLIAVIDVATRTILGYSMTTNENYNQTDILRALRNSIIPKNPITFSIEGFEYPPNYGYPSLAIPAVEWAMPDTIMLDNAKSHLAHNAVNKLCSDLNCSLNFGSVATPEVRGIVERLFGTLEENGFHRLPSTTGSNIYDARRINAEQDAIKYQIRYQDILELTEYFIALYNNSSHDTLDNQTPLECMERRILDAGMMPSLAFGEMKEMVYKLTTFTELKIIRGSVKHGKRPYITYKGVEYRNDILSQSMGLIGKKLIIEINPDDIHIIIGYFEDGSELGILTAVGEWGRKSHSLKTREEAIRMSNYNKHNHSPFYAPLSEYEAVLNERAVEQRRARTKAARIRTEQNKDLQAYSAEPIYPIKQRSMLTASQEELAIKQKMETYTKEEMEAIQNAGSLEEAFNQGLI